MNIAMIGTGYVGLVTGTCFAEMGNTVYCYDNNEAKIKVLNDGGVPIYEPGLAELIQKNTKDGRLLFTTNLQEVVDNSLIIFICVGTPPLPDGSADLSNIRAVTEQIAALLNEYRIVAVKSTVPPGTCKWVSETIQKELSFREKHFLEYDVVSNPEFLKEGDAIKDFMFPDRVVIGTDNIRTAEIMRTLYGPFMRERDKVIVMNVESSEVTKYASNGMLATRISFMNELANYCEKIGADVEQVRKGMGSDSRIGPRFLYPGLGYGGSCFPKDVRALISSMKEKECYSYLLDAVHEVNRQQWSIFFEKIQTYFGEGGLQGKTVGVWGLSFKPKTDDVRESPSLNIVTRLLQSGAVVLAFDPEAAGNAAHELESLRGEGNLWFTKSLYAAAKGADFVILATEWPQFRNPDFQKLKEIMKAPVIFDGRNQYNPKEMARLGFTYFCVGRPTG